MDKLFGASQSILADGGREFQNEFIEFTEKWGIEMLGTASESPWSNGKCERMVGLLKEGMRKLKEDGIKDKRMCLALMVSARNGMIMNSGFSPNQKVFGRNVGGISRIEEMNPAQLEDTIESDKLAKIMEIQKRTKEEWMQLENEDRIKRALKGKIKMHHVEEAQLGDKFFIKEKKKINGEDREK